MTEWSNVTDKGSGPKTNDFQAKSLFQNNMDVCFFVLNSLGRTTSKQIPITKKNKNSATIMESPYLKT